MKRVLWLVALVLGSAGAAAAETSVHAELDARKLGVEDQVQLSLVLDGDTNLAQEVSLPRLQGLRAVLGPSVSTQVSFVNGAMSQRRVYTWVLQPTAVGKAEVGAFAVKLASGEKATAPIAAEVVAGSVRPAPQRQAADPFGGQDPFESMFRRGQPNRPAPKVLVKAIASRDRVHVGEPLLLTYYVYTQTSVTDLRVGDAPQYPGFWTEDLPQPEGGPRGEPATLEGESFQRFAFLRRLLFPTRSGTLKVPAATFQVGVARRGFFDMGETRVTRRSDEVEVTALPIPEEPGFQGAVGRFHATATLDKPSVALGEAATLRFRVEGSGNLKWIDKGPALEVRGAKVYPPSATSDLKPGLAGISGSKTWEFTIVPETAGTLEVPSLTFAYFDPAAGRIVRGHAAATSRCGRSGRRSRGARLARRSDAGTRHDGAARGDGSSGPHPEPVGATRGPRADGRDPAARGATRRSRARGSPPRGARPSRAPAHHARGAVRDRARGPRRPGQGGGRGRAGARTARRLRAPGERRVRSDGPRPRGPRRARGRPLPPLRAAARRLLRQDPRGGRARGRPRPEVVVSGAALVGLLLLTASPAERFREANEAARGGDLRRRSPAADVASPGAESASLYRTGPRPRGAWATGGCFALLRARELDGRPRGGARVERVRGRRTSIPRRSRRSRWPRWAAGAGGCIFRCWRSRWRPRPSCCTRPDGRGRVRTT